MLFLGRAGITLRRCSTSSSLPDHSTSLPSAHLIQCVSVSCSWLLLFISQPYYLPFTFPFLELKREWSSFSLLMFCLFLGSCPQRQPSHGELTFVLLSQTIDSFFLRGLGEAVKVVKLIVSRNFWVAGSDPDEDKNLLFSYHIYSPLPWVCAIWCLLFILFYFCFSAIVYFTKCSKW